MRPTLDRRQFSQAALTATLGSAAAAHGLPVAADDRPAVLGGPPAWRGTWPAWPIADGGEEQALREVVQSGRWFRYAAGGPSTVDGFEQQWARQVGAAHCQATNSGTSSLIASLAALEIGPGDEVLIPPYTFVATVNAVLMHYALPVFVDTDPATAQWDLSLVEARIADATRAMAPVHLGGASCDMEALMTLARRRGLAVVEDACQAHTGEWRGRRLGTWGDIGCFSFQNGKHLTCGDGGAAVTSDAMLYGRVQAWHNQGIARSPDPQVAVRTGGNFRLTQFQGAILQQQLKRLEEHARQREQNAARLRELLSDVPGVAPKKILPGTTRHGCHLFVFDFDPAVFAGMAKSQFVRAVAAEGIPIAGGYAALHRQPWVERMLTNRGYQQIYGASRLRRWREENVLPANDRMLLTTCWFPQTTLLAEPSAMDRIAEALRRVQRHAAEIVRAA